MSTVFIKTFDEPNINIKEIYRYCGMKEIDGNFENLVKECLNECKNVFKYSVCYTVLPCNSVFCGIDSTLLKTRLSNCENAVIFGATVGIGIDRLIEKYVNISPSKALIFQAIGAERTEGLCDAFCQFLKKEYKNITSRFSPGYGDFPLSSQKEIFSLLGCEKRIGLTLNDSLIMSPSKSVTAVLGICDTETQNCTEKCQNCGKKDCIFRRSV